MWLPRRLPSPPEGRHALAVLLLVAHAFAAAGAPVPVSHSANPRASQPPYPCRDHACGCLTAEQCWAGDCCCFTLEQKLDWAAARGIEPPASAAAAAAARKAAAPPKKAKRPCCRGEDEAALPVAACSGPTCDREAVAAEDAGDDALAVLWVAGVRAQKCRGEGPAGLLKIDPAVPPAASPVAAIAPEPDRFARPASVPPVPLSQQPPARPPRR